MRIYTIIKQEDSTYRVKIHNTKLDLKYFWINTFPDLILAQNWVNEQQKNDRIYDKNKRFRYCNYEK